MSRMIGPRWIPSAARVSIRAKIVTVFLLSLIGYILLGSVLFWQAMRQSTEYQASQGARQSADLLISGIHSELDYAISISYNLLQNVDIPRWLSSETKVRDLVTTRNANQVLMRTYPFFPGLESIYLFANDGEGIRASHHLSIQTFEDIRETSWHARAVERRGGFFVTLNADGTLFSTAGMNNISLIRQVLDLNSMKPLGFLIINLNETFISNTTKQIYAKYNTKFYILDENGSSVLKGQELPDFGDSVPPDGAVRRVGDETLFLYQTHIPDLGWTVISASPYNVLSGVPYFPQMFLLPVLSSVGMYILGMVFTANLITKPVDELIASMRGVREGRFEPMPTDKRQDEFGQLKGNYNIMVSELNAMIQQRVRMEKEKRKHELDILGEQVKPHFLYNTLDTISYLILSGDNQGAAEAVTALSSYYRVSLNKGAETVPLSEEISMIRNYLSLQKTRYGEMISDRYDVAPDAGAVPVLRNILQPLVENCIYHGIKPGGEPGLITITASIQGKALLIMVEDDGMGMTPEQLGGLDVDILDQNLTSFGLRGTIKRLRLFYNREDVYEVKSEPGLGTCVLLKIPAGKEDVIDG